MNRRWHQRVLLFLLSAGYYIFSATGVFADVSLPPQPCGAEAPCNEGSLSEEEKGILVPEMPYDELKALIDSGKPYLLLDARAETMFNEGHIPTALSLPLETISLQRAQEILKPVEHIIVYCQSRMCKTSHNAAVKLIGYGFSVKDYKGGIQEWVEKGNTLKAQMRP